MGALGNPWVLLAAVLMWGGSLVAVGHWQHHDGGLAATNACVQAHNAELIAKQATIDALTRKAREDNEAHAMQIEAIGTWLARETKDAEARRVRDVNNARALWLRQQPKCPSGSGGGSEAGAVTSASGGSDGAEGCQLPATTVRDLVGLVSDADRDVRQLQACQRVVADDRKEMK